MGIILLCGEILHGRSLLQKGIIIGIGNGRSTSLWYHHWVGSGPLYKLIDKDIPESKSHWYVSNIIRNGKWYLDNVRHIIPTDLCNLILSTPLSMHDDQEDLLDGSILKMVLLLSNQLILFKQILCLNPLIIPLFSLGRVYGK